MPPPAIPRRKLSIKDRLINSPEQPIRVPKLELVRKDPKKKSKESKDEKVIVIKPTEDEKKRLEQSEDSYEVSQLLSFSDYKNPAACLQRSTINRTADDHRARPSSRGKTEARKRTSSNANEVEYLEKN